MKKIFALLLVSCLLFSLSGCQKVMKGTDDLIEKAREIIPVADAENIEITYAGLRCFQDAQLSNTNPLVALGSSLN